MSRLEKKCTLTAAALHGLLLVILLVGPALVPDRKNKDDQTRVISLINPSDLPGAGGGNPNVPPTPPPPPAAEKKNDPVPPTPKQEEPPKVEKVEVKTPDPVKLKDPIKLKEPVKLKDPITPVKPPTDRPTSPKHEVKVNTNVVKHATSDSAATQVQRAAQQARADAIARQNALARAFGNSAKTLGNNLSGATTVDTFGPGGAAYANYGLIVREIYDRAWLVSDALGDEDSTVKVSIIIARDGTVLSARIIKSSGVPALDKSVQKTLNDVKTIVPFPADSKDTQRQFDINFNLKAKRLSA